MIEGIPLDDSVAYLDALGADELPINPDYHPLHPSRLDCADWDAIQAFGAC